MWRATRWVAAVAISALLVAPLAVSGDTAVHNGDFEVSTPDGAPVGWRITQGDARLITPGFTGERAVALTVGPGGQAAIRQTIAVPALAQITAQAMIALPDADAGEARLRVSAIGGEAFPSSVQARPQTGWQALRVAMVAPSGVTAVELAIVVSGRSHTTTVAIDAVSLQVVAAPPTTPPTASPPAPPGPTPATPSPTTPPPRAPTPTVTPAASVAAPSRLHGALILAQVMIAPDATPEAAHEWVEIRNVSRDPVSLADCAVSDGAAATRLPAVVLPANGHVTLAATSRFLDRHPGYDGMVALSATGRVGNGLRNDGGVIALVCHGVALDALSYGDDASVFDPPLPKPVVGGFMRRTATAPASAADWAPMRQRPPDGAPPPTLFLPIASVRR